MNVSHRVRWSLLAAVLAAGCSDSSGPSTPAISDLVVSGVRTNADNFRANGDFALGLLATTPDGEPILNEGVEITATLTQVGASVQPEVSGLSLQSTNFTLTSGVAVAERPGSRNTMASVLIDDSGSMSSTDPQRLRAGAARVFWQAFLAARTGNRVSILDFGAGSTSGFGATRLLQDFTSDQSLLESALQSIVASGSTPLYRSLRETSDWMAATTSANDNRVILLLSDGQPTDGGLRESALTAAANANITVHTVGLGPASELSTFPSSSAIQAVREIADRRNGVYASATDAAALSGIFNTLAQVTAKGQLVSNFRISPVPPSGTRVTGTVTVRSGGREATAVWSFLAP
jgi:Mg-chelatase subunit ChlD